MLVYWRNNKSIWCKNIKVPPKRIPDVSHIRRGTAPARANNASGDAGRQEDTS